MLTVVLADPCNKTDGALKKHHLKVYFQQYFKKKTAG